VAEQKRESVRPAQAAPEDPDVPRWSRTNYHIQCQSCRGAAARCARARTIRRDPDTVQYLAYLWRCSVCGDEWEDDVLRGLNAAAASQARAPADEP
jgi:hypothetical protein